MASIQSLNLTGRHQPPRKPTTSLQYLAISFAVLTTITSLTGCATQGVTKATGRATDPPLDLVLYCLFFPGDPACRGIVK